MVNKRQNRIVAAMAAGVILLPFWAAPALAQNVISVRSALEDTGQYFTSPLRWDETDWTYFGITAAAVAIAHQYDDSTRAHYAVGAKAKLGGKNSNGTRDALPAVALIAATGLSAAMLADHDGYEETWSLIEAGVFSTATGEIMKIAAGRERPDVTTSPNVWRHGGDSFPSVHASAAFAIGTVFAESGSDEYRWVRRVVGYAIAGGTSYIRVRENVHWLSDTVAGAAIGIATARFVLNRRMEDAHPAVRFEPLKDGWMLAFSVGIN